MWHPSHDHQTVVSCLLFSLWLADCLLESRLIGLFLTCPFSPLFVPITDCVRNTCNFGSLVHKMEGINEGMGPRIEGNNASELHFHPGSFSEGMAPSNLTSDWSPMKMIFPLYDWVVFMVSSPFSDYSQGQQSVGQRLRWAGPGCELETRTVNNASHLHYPFQAISYS